MVYVILHTLKQKLSVHHAKCISVHGVNSLPAYSLLTEYGIKLINNTTFAPFSQPYFASLTKPAINLYEGHSAHRK